MAHYCDICRQPYADDLACCPRCQSLVNGNGKPTASDATPLPVQRRQPAGTPRPAEEDAQIDLGSPVGEAVADPPSGASFVSWSSYLAKKKDVPGKDDDALQFGTPSSAKILLDPPSGTGSDSTAKQPEVAEDDAAIDLGSPVTADPEKDGPPSGASFVSWEALIRSRKNLEDDAPAPLAPAGLVPAGASARLMLEGGPPPEPTPAPVTDVRIAPGRSWLTIVVLGIVLGMAVCLGLWLAAGK